MVQFSHPYMTIGKTIPLTIWTFVSKVMSLVFNMLSGFVTSFSSKEQASFNFVATVTLCSDFGAKKNKICHCFYFFPIYLPSDRNGCHDLCFLECWVLSQLFHSRLLPSSRGFLVPLSFLPLEWYHLNIWGCWYFSRQSWFQLWVIQPGILPLYSAYKLNKQDDSI